MMLLIVNQYVKSKITRLCNTTFRYLYNFNDVVVLEKTLGYSLLKETQE
jgi:hypothetical protein